MSTPTPPEGYRIVHNSEIPIVPEGALFYPNGGYAWENSRTIGERPTPERHGVYAIPIVKEDAKEVEMLKAEIEAMRKHIGNQDAAMSAARNELAELSARNSASITCINKQVKIIDALLQLIKE